MASRVCGVCKTKSSSLWFIISEETVNETAICFNIEISPGASLCSSCRGSLSRWRNREPEEKYFCKADSRGQQFARKTQLAKNSRRTAILLNNSESTSQSCPFCHLPDHLLINIFTFLATSDLPRLRLTCHFINNPCSSKYFWKLLLERGFCQKQHLLDRSALSNSALSYKLLYSVTLDKHRNEVDAAKRFLEKEDKILAENEAFRKSLSVIQTKMNQLESDKDPGTPVTRLQDQVF